MAEQPIYPTCDSDAPTHTLGNRSRGRLRATTPRSTRSFATPTLRSIPSMCLGVLEIAARWITPRFGGSSWADRALCRPHTSRLTASWRLRVFATPSLGGSLMWRSHGRTTKIPLLTSPQARINHASLDAGPDSEYPPVTSTASGPIRVAAANSGPAPNVPGTVTNRADRGSKSSAS
jgi:hypothetical protein